MRRSSIAGTLAYCLCLAISGFVYAQGPQPENSGPESGLPAESDLAAEIEQVAFQDIAAQPSAAPRLATTPTARRSGSSQYMRLARVPNMFGDSLPPCGGLEVMEFPSEIGVPDAVTPQEVGPQQASIFGFPCPGGGPAKIAENDKALPVDRVFFYYNGFSDAIMANVSGSQFGSPGVSAVEINSPGSYAYDFDRYTIGFEKTFNEKRNSFEIRMPFNSGFELEQSDPFDFPTVPGINADGVGNLAFVLKHVLWQNDDEVVALGLSFDVPTGSDVEGSIGTADFILHNDTSHFSPFLGFMCLPSDDCFVLGFVQLGIPLQGNEIVVSEEGIEEDDVGEVKEQNLLYLDLSAGYWIDRRWLAAVVELHYTTTLEDADTADFGVFDDETFTFKELTFGNGANRVDYLNMAIGLHGQITRQTNVRVAGVIPLRDESDEPFESEVQVAVNHHF